MPSTDYSATQIMETVGSIGSPVIPGGSNWYLGASTTTPVFAQGDDFWNFTEPSDVAYARQNFTWTAPGSQPTNGFAIEPTGTIDFPPATTGYGTVTYYGVFDAATSGNLWFIIPLTRVVTDGVLTEGATSLTSATASFTSGDAGAGIYAIGIPIGTTIYSYTNSTTIVLSARSAVGATGVTVAINTPQAVTSGNTLQVPSLLLVQT